MLPLLSAAALQSSTPPPLSGLSSLFKRPATDGASHTTAAADVKTLKPVFRADAIRLKKRYGPFVLPSTNVSSYEPDTLTSRRETFSLYFRRIQEC